MSLLKSSVILFIVWTRAKLIFYSILVIKYTPAVSLEGKKISTINTRSFGDLSPSSDWSLLAMLSSDWSALSLLIYLALLTLDTRGLLGGHWSVSSCLMLASHLISSDTHNTLYLDILLLALIDC